MLYAITRLLVYVANRKRPAGSIARPCGEAANDVAIGVSWPLAGSMLKAALTDAPTYRKRPRGSMASGPGPAATGSGDFGTCVRLPPSIAKPDTVPLTL